MQLSDSWQKCKSKTFLLNAIQFATAMKVRAAIRYHYLYMEAEASGFYCDELRGKWVGNPACSLEVHKYMSGLQRRKVYAGERPASVRALQISTIEELYDHCGGDTRPDVNALGARQYVSRLSILIQSIYHFY
jgi:hypothetical protein